MLPLVLTALICMPFPKLPDTKLDSTRLQQPPRSDPTSPHDVPLDQVIPYPDSEFAESDRGVVHRVSVDHAATGTPKHDAAAEHRIVAHRAGDADGERDATERFDQIAANDGVTRCSENCPHPRPLRGNEDEVEHLD